MAISRLAKDIAKRLVDVGLVEHSFDDVEVFGEDEDDLLREIQSVITKHSRAEQECKVAPRREETWENG